MNSAWNSSFYTTIVAESLQTEIRQEFVKNKDVEDAYGIKYLLSDGRTRLKQLKETLGMQS